MGTTYRSAISYGGNVAVVDLVKEVLDAFGYFYQDAKMCSVLTSCPDASFIS
ncbi:MAG TPA: hypothetical protein VL087_04600 [Nitrospirota bacterium]|nr:hypothetical protein [Nitrospirota bacterium]